MRNVLIASLILASTVLAMEATASTTGFMHAEPGFGLVAQANPVADALLWVRTR